MSIEELAKKADALSKRFDAFVERKDAELPSYYVHTAPNGSLHIIRTGVRGIKKEYWVCPERGTSERSY